MASKSNKQNKTEKPVEDAALPEEKAVLVPSEPAPRPPRTVVPSREPQLTAARAFQGSSDPIVKSFLSVERLLPALRKMTASEWKSALNKFKTQER